MTTLMLRRPLAVVLTTFLMGALAACGGDDGGSGSELPDAAGASSESAGADSGAADADISAEDARLKFAECMRENGIDVPDPGPNGEMMVSPQGVSQEQVEAAHEACQEWLDVAMPEDGEGPQMSEEEKQALLDMAQCMRDRGYDFPDPEFDGGRVTQRLQGVDPEDPAVQSDMEECREESGMTGGPGTSEQES